MQRSLPLFIVLAAAAGFGAWYVFDWLGLAAFAGVLAVSLGGGLLATLRLAPRRKPASIRTLPSATTEPARARVLGRARRAAKPALVMEPGSAQLADPHPETLAMTGDILKEMQTHKTTRGRCSQCNSTLWLSARRPVKAKCPVCGFTRILD